MSIIEKLLPLTCDGLNLSCGSAIPENPMGVALLLHGIPSVNPPDPDDTGYPGLSKQFAERGWAAVWGDMRAVRGSEGFFSIEGWVRDAEAMTTAACSIEGAAELPLALIGSSAGGAVAAEVARRGAPVDALVLLAAPAAWVSFADEADAAIRRITQEAGMKLEPEILEDPSRWLEEFEGVTTERSLRDVRIPTLIVHGTADDVVPVGHAHRLAEVAPKADLEIVEGGEHQLRRDPRVVDLVLDWLRRTVQ